MRLVRGQDGEVRGDPAARMEGRGAYVCTRSECADSLAASRSLTRAFRAPVTVKPQSIELIREWQRSAFTR
jgi:predicted RNA-binding protein YlxR (DUF448 family)